MSDQFRCIDATSEWNEIAENYTNHSCLVKEWELVNLEIDGQNMQFLFGTVVTDYKNRWKYGDYVFTSYISSFDTTTGLVRTSNSLYCLQGPGVEVYPTLQEAAIMKTTGQSLRMIRAMEGAGLKILGPHHGPGG